MKVLESITQEGELRPARTIMTHASRRTFQMHLFRYWGDVIDNVLNDSNVGIGEDKLVGGLLKNVDLFEVFRPCEHTLGLSTTRDEKTNIQ